MVRGGWRYFSGRAKKILPHTLIVMAIPREPHIFLDKLILKELEVLISGEISLTIDFIWYNINL